MLAPSQFGHARACWVGGKEIAHIDEPSGVLELRLTRRVISELRQRLKAEPSVTLRRSGGDWIELEPAETPAALTEELFAAAVAAHRKNSPTPGPSPDEIARRRRLHGGRG